MSFFRNLVYGLVIGVANIIPGVSGGTMAVVLNVYDRLIDAVSGLRKAFRENILFLIPIGLGALSGILLFSKLIAFLLGSFPMPTNFFFLGLILGSIPMIAKRAQKEPFRKTSLLPFLAALVLMLGVTLASILFQSGNAVFTELTPFRVIQLFLCSVVAAACMILPGISGSMVLMLLGVYTSVLSAISQLRILFLIPVALGVLVGILGGAKVISLCLKRHEQATYFAILGLIAGSLLPVLLNAGFAINEQTIASVVTLLAGVWIAQKMNQLEKRLVTQGGRQESNDQ